MFKVYDNYDLDMELIAECETKQEVNKVVRDQNVDTDGECDIIIEEIK